MHTEVRFTAYTIQGVPAYPNAAKVGHYTMDMTEAFKVGGVIKAYAAVYKDSRYFGAVTMNLASREVGGHWASRNVFLITSCLNMTCPRMGAATLKKLTRKLQRILNRSELRTQLNRL